MSPTFSSSYYIYTTFFLVMAQGGLGTIFTLVNRCDYTVWPGILPNSGSSDLGSSGFQLQPGATVSFQTQSSWSGRLWGRTSCSFDLTTGQGSCATGDCGSNQLECNGNGATPPATLAEFTIGSTGAQDFYDVSLVDGYNLPMMIEAVGGSGTCGQTDCAADINGICPEELRAVNGQACRSACGAFMSDEYCCRGPYGSPVTCRPSIYSEVFKNACPRSYSYAYDDATSTFTCIGADYTITFCPSVTNGESSSSSPATSENTSSQPPPPATVDGYSFQPRYNEYPPAWLPDFVIGGSSHFDVNYYLIICTTIILFLSLHI